MTARARLTLLLTALVLAAGGTLTFLTYVLTKQNLRHRSVFVDLDPGASPSPPPWAADAVDLSDRLVADTLSALLSQAALSLAVVTVLAAVLGWLVAGRVLRPIRAISSAARRLSAENLTERVPVTAPADELSGLAGTVNGMLDRIQRGVEERDRILESQRLFTANAAHELRTPLTTARTAIDVTLDGDPDRDELRAMANDVRDAVEHLQRILDGLLLLARSQAGLSAREPTDLAAIATVALDAAGERTLGLAVNADLRPVPVCGEPVLLEQMVGNLVDNAIRYNHPGGDLRITTGTTNGHAVFRIVNSGRKIPPHEAESLLEPFVHRDGSRVRADGGLGLGLSIVRAIADAHRGSIMIAAPTGGGLDIRIDLPAHSPSARATSVA
ncbi:sensor histidine kinase [Glycomyces algeriensis]|nr:ATP-binding protein [Glycomyces algeriensis]MDA1367813.1 ATP-binding protein [Glycomyces algeriensis]MDR7351959.1 signal transduction histidine kinase [Glycomyces algeriensis]